MNKRYKIRYPISVAILYFVGDTGDMVDTLEGVKALTEALRERGHVVRTMEVNKKNWKKALAITGDVIFNMVEDREYVLYMKIAKALELLGRAQVGISAKGLKYAVHKSRIKRRLRSLGLKTPKYRIIKENQKDLKLKGMNYPLIIKPSGEHAGIGINQDSVVIDEQELNERVKYLQGIISGDIIAEEFIDGREIHITVLGNEDYLVALPPAEITFGGEYEHNWNVYTFEAKWEKGTWEYADARVACPTMIDRKTKAKMEKLAYKAFAKLECRDIARFDMRLDDKGRAFIIDVNMSPSLNAYDDQDASIVSARAQRWGYEELIEKVVAITYKRGYGKMPDRIKERNLMLPLPRISL